MISWTTILYGGALTLALVAAVIWIVARDFAATMVAACAVTGGAIAWNAILHSIDSAGGFFVDAPIVIFPASWQDTGSGVFAFSATALALGFGGPTGTTRPPGDAPGHDRRARGIRRRRLPLLTTAASGVR